VVKVQLPKYRKFLVKAKKAGDLPQESSKPPSPPPTTTTTTDANTKTKTKSELKNGNTTPLHVNGKTTANINAKVTPPENNGKLAPHENGKEGNENGTDGKEREVVSSGGGGGGHSVPLTEDERQHVVVLENTTGDDSNELYIRNIYSSNKTPTRADAAFGLHVGDKVLVKDGDERLHAVCECFNILENMWCVRYQADFKSALVPIWKLEVFERHQPKPRAKVEIEHNGIVTCVERLAEYDRTGKKLLKPIIDVARRPTRMNLPYLYPEKPEWTPACARKLLTSIGCAEVAAEDINLSQRETDAKWKDFMYLGQVKDCNLTRHQQKLKGGRITLKEWNERLEMNGYERVSLIPPHVESTVIEFKTFMEVYGFPMIDESTRDEARIGVSHEFAPHECDHCGIRATSLPSCECGESYCSPACRLAEWKVHKEVCEMALDNMCLVPWVDKLYMRRKGYRYDCEGVEITLKST